MLLKNRIQPGSPCTSHSTSPNRQSIPRSVPWMLCGLITWNSLFLLCKLSSLANPANCPRFPLSTKNLFLTSLHILMLHRQLHFAWEALPEPQWLPSSWPPLLPKQTFLRKIEQMDQRVQVAWIAWQLDTSFKKASNLIYASVYCVIGYYKSTPRTLL